MSVAIPCTAPEVAVIVVIPTISPLASPAELIVAIGAPELHIADEVKFCVLPSVYVPVAQNCTDKPAGTVPLAGVTPMDISAGGPTVSVAELLVMPSRLAVMLVVPTATPLANPALLIVAADVLEEFHTAALLRSVVDPSTYVPVAENCCVCPTEAEALAGATVIDVSPSNAAPVVVSPDKVNVRYWIGEAADQTCVEGSCVRIPFSPGRAEVLPVVTVSELLETAPTFWVRSTMWNRAPGTTVGKKSKAYVPLSSSQTWVTLVAIMSVELFEGLPVPSSFTISTYAYPSL